MSKLFSSEQEFRADVEAMQAEYEAKCKALRASMDDTQWAKFLQRKCLPTATGTGARGDWSWNPDAVKCSTDDFTPVKRTRKAKAFVPPRLWSI